MIFFQRKVVGDSSLLLSEELVKGINIVRQTDTGFGVDAQAGPGGLLSPEALLIRSLPHDLVMGGISCFGSWHERNSRGRATIQKDHGIPIHSRYTGFLGTHSTVTPSINSTHDLRCGSPVAPREKDRDPYVNSTGSLTLLQVERKANFQVSTRDEA